MISGLTVGAQYQVGFYWAGAQQYTYGGDTTEQWLVSLGSQQLSTNVVGDGNHGFTGWTHTYLTFTATSSSEVLAFLAAGTPNGLPPFSLLDGVTMTAVPEPASMSLLARASPPWASSVAASSAKPKHFPRLRPQAIPHSGAAHPHRVSSVFVSTPLRPANWSGTVK